MIVSTQRPRLLQPPRINGTQRQFAAFMGSINKTFLGLGIVVP
ncbi:hypothetical protein SSYM_1185 [Serratia symbiotica str. Tucson]|uniref:Uncharacterized protein n=1 Tax=Serratia symbiotica str. Tucson TaxID=914128 RepID=E9CLQ2_9GAMM|nr:hypothetical protein SSYM_1185 [Serratia symbiotica str. Tucson]